MRTVRSIRPLHPCQPRENPMGVYDSQGQPHHSLSRAKFHDSVKAKPAAQPPEKSAAPAAHPAPTKTPIAEHVKEHGPAHKIEYHHEEAEGKHHVTSHHGSGGDHEKHHSVHHSPEDAHKHMSAAMGVGHEETQQEEDNESPDQMSEPESAGN